MVDRHSIITISLRFNYSTLYLYLFVLNFLSHSLVLLTVKLIKTSFSRLLYNNQFSWDMNNREFFFSACILRGNCGVIGDTHDNTPSKRMIKSLDTNKHWAHSLRPSCVMNFVDAHHERPKTAFAMRFLHHCRLLIVNFLLTPACGHIATYQIVYDGKIDTPCFAGSSHAHK